MRRFVCLLAGALSAGVLIAGCSFNFPTSAPVGTRGPTVTGTVALTGTLGVTVAPAGTASVEASTGTPPADGTSTAAPTATVASNGSPDPSGSEYLDDRSDAARLMASFVQALNRKEYARAYSYWEVADRMIPYAQFELGYSNTQSVSLTLGAMSGSAGAGQFYTTVPAAMVARANDGAVETFAGCYVLHLSSPTAQATPPFKPLAITMAAVQKVANDADTAALMGQVCNQQGIPQGSPLQPADPSQRYVDDRSGPAQLIESFANALNRHEYLRAYSYWEPAAQAQLPAFPQFAQGYANTQAVSVTFGTIASDAGAGQFHYTVPATLKVATADGKRQTFVGCYRLHLANPGIQAPPFQSLGITSATMKGVDEGADTAALMNQICQGVS
jgi:hypothetical protein